MKTHVVVLPAFISPEILEELYISNVSKNRAKKILIDCHDLKSMNSVSFDSLKHLIRNAKLLGYEASLCQIPPHIALVMCEWSIEDIFIEMDCYANS